MANAEMIEIAILPSGMPSAITVLLTSMVATAALDPVVVPQHTAYQTLLVLLVRLVMEPTTLNRVISPPVLALCGLLWGLEPLLGRLVPSDSLTSGYLVAGRKPAVATRGPS